MNTKAQTSLELLLVVSALIAVAIILLAQLHTSATAGKNLLKSRTNSAVKMAKQIK